MDKTYVRVNAAGDVKIFSVDSPPPPLNIQQNTETVGVVTMRQARLALLAAGKLQAVDDAINQLPDPPRSAARVTWDYSQSIERHNPFVLQIGGLIGLSAEDLDALFAAAAAL